MEMANRIGAIDPTALSSSTPNLCAARVAPGRETRNLPGDIAKTFSVTKLIDKLAAEIRPQTPRSTHRLQIHLRADARTEHFDWRRRSGGIGTSLYLPERDATVSAALPRRIDGLHGRSLGERWPRSIRIR